MNRKAIILTLTSALAAHTFGANCPNSPQDTSVKSYTKTVEASGDLIDSINDKIKSFTPSLTCEVSSGSASATGTMENCCDGQEEKVNGVKSVSGSVSISGSVGGNLWGTSYETSKSKTIFNTTYTFDVGAELGLPLNVDLSSQSTVGYVKNECDAEEWWYGEFSISATPSIEITANGEYCIKVNGDDKFDGEFEVTPLNVTVNMHRDLGYNTEDSECGGYSEAEIDDITATISFKIPGLIDWSKAFNIWGGSA